MTLLEQIQDQLRRLPPEKQSEVLGFYQHDLRAEWDGRA